MMLNSQCTYPYPTQLRMGSGQMQALRCGCGKVHRMSSTVGPGLRAAYESVMSAWDTMGKLLHESSI
jgi:hypothetical protein